MSRSIIMWQLVTHSGPLELQILGQRPTYLKVSGAKNNGMTHHWGVRIGCLSTLGLSNQGERYVVPWHSWDHALIIQNSQGYWSWKEGSTLYFCHLISSLPKEWCAAAVTGYQVQQGPLLSGCVHIHKHWLWIRTDISHPPKYVHHPLIISCVLW